LKDLNQIRFKLSSKIAPETGQELTKEDKTAGKFTINEVELTFKPELVNEASKEKEKVPIYKNLQANDTRFSEGLASYFYDILSPLLEEEYRGEAEAAFKAARGAEENKLENTADGIKESDYVTYDNFITFMDNWKEKMEDFTAEDYFKIYTTGYNRKKMYIREFLFM